MELDSALHNYAQLVELKNDARRVKTDAKRLTELNPFRADSYKRQLLSVLDVLNDEADRLAGGRVST